MAISEDRGEETAGRAEAEALTEAAQRHRASQQTHDPYAALRFSDFRALVVGTSLATLGEQMLTVAIGWDLYARTNSALMLGFVGLAQFAPVLALSLVAGHAADRYDRRTLVIVEVKSRTGTRCGSPLEAVSRAKRARLRRLAVQWLNAHGIRFDQVRVDVVGLVYDGTGGFTVEYVPGVG